MTEVRTTEHMAERLLETQQAFDGVAPEYDGPRGNNALVQNMRRTLWDTVAATFPTGARLADLGCGTGLDAAHFGRRGYHVLALDWSPGMVRQTERRIRRAHLEEQVSVRHLGIQDLDTLDGGRFDGIYSNLGALNCTPDLKSVAHASARLLRRGGRLVCSVMGRYCPWESTFYLLQGRPSRAFVRLRWGMVPVGLNGGTVWTQYYSPREFYRAFQDDFTLSHCRALALFAPPPYLIVLHRKAKIICDVLSWVDERVGHWPLLKNAGDHFLMVLTKRE